MSNFNAKAARAKRPCPVWVDAFQRDTQHLQADEIGAYFLILMAMWTRESCDFPDDDARLARVSRVSSRLWRSRIGPVIREFLGVEDGAVFSKRLREEATYVERQVQQQSYRKAGEKSDKPLKYNEPPQSADGSTDEPRNHPSQQPNNLEIPEADASGRDAASDDHQADFAKEVFDRAIAFLGRHGVREAQARSFVGKLRKDGNPDAAIFDAFSRCSRAGAVDPIPWIAKALGAPSSAPNNDNIIRMVIEAQEQRDREIAASRGRDFR